MDSGSDIHDNAGMDQQCTALHPGGLTCVLARAHRGKHANGNTRWKGDHRGKTPWAPAGPRCGKHNPDGTRICTLPKGHPGKRSHADADGVQWTEPLAISESERAVILLRIVHDQMLMTYDPNDPRTWETTDTMKCQSVDNKTGRQCMLDFPHERANHICQTMDELMRGDDPIEWEKNQAPIGKKRSRA